MRVSTKGVGGNLNVPSFSAAKEHLMRINSGNAEMQLSSRNGKEEERTGMDFRGPRDQKGHCVPSFKESHVWLEWDYWAA